MTKAPDIEDSISILGHLDACQGTLSLLGYLLQCDCSMIKLDSKPTTIDLSRLSIEFQNFFPRKSSHE